jgi:hypothetical protein
MARISNDYMVQNVDFNQLTPSDEVTCDFDVGFGRTRIATRMIVLCGARSYVQSCVRGSEIPVPSRRKGVPCLKANHSRRLRRTRPFAN